MCFCVSRPQTWCHTCTGLVMHYIFEVAWGWMTEDSLSDWSAQVTPGVWRRSDWVFDLLNRAGEMMNVKEAWEAHADVSGGGSRGSRSMTARCRGEECLWFRPFMSAGPCVSNSVCVWRGAAQHVEWSFCSGRLWLFTFCSAADGSEAARMRRALKWAPSSSSWSELHSSSVLLSHMTLRTPHLHHEEDYSPTII